MRRSLLCATGLLIAVSLPGCGSSPEDTTVKEYVTVMNETAAIFEIKDPASGKEAEGKLKALMERGEALDKKMKEMPKEKVEAAKKKYDAEIKAARERMDKATGFKMDPAKLGPRP